MHTTMKTISILLCLLLSTVSRAQVSPQIDLPNAPTAGIDSYIRGVNEAQAQAQRAQQMKIRQQEIEQFEAERPVREAKLKADLLEQEERLRQLRAKGGAFDPTTAQPVEEKGRLREPPAKRGKQIALSDLLTEADQKRMGFDKLTEKEREQLRIYLADKLEEREQLKAYYMGKLMESYSAAQAERLRQIRAGNPSTATEVTAPAATVAAKKQARAFDPSTAKPVAAPASIASAKKRVYADEGGEHWIDKNIDDGEMLLLEDGSLWEVEPGDTIDAMLWLPTSDITVLRSDKGSPGYDYMLVNTDDGEKVHAKFLTTK